MGGLRVIHALHLTNCSNLVVIWLWIRVHTKIELYRKDLALNALRSRYGQESSLLASEDRLLGGVFQHRAGQFPWGTSKKDREKSRKLASSISVQEPLPAGARKREHANSPASMPPVVPIGPLLIDLLDVKEEEVHLVRRVRTTFW